MIETENCENKKWTTKKNLQFDLRARVIHVHVRFCFSLFFALQLLAAIRPIHFIITLGLRTCVCVGVWLCVNCYSTPLIRKLLDVMDTLYTRNFQVHVPICARVAVAVAVFTHKRQTFSLVCVCVWELCAHDVLSISILIFISSKTSIALLQFDVVVWRNFSMRPPPLSQLSPLSISPSSAFTFFLYIIIFHQCRCHFAILQMNFFHRCDVKCLSNPIKASITHAKWSTNRKKKGDRRKSVNVFFSLDSFNQSV